MAIDLATILRLIEDILEAEKKISSAISAEKNARRRAVLLKACQDRDLKAIRELLYDED